MNYLRNVVSDVKLKYRAGRVVSDCITKREQPEFQQYLMECVALADGHPELILSILHDYISFNHPENAYGGLLLLEQLVSLCNYGFHVALAKDYNIQDRIIQLAVRRGEGEAHRKAQRLARLTLLEYSRVFVDDRELLRLSSLASSFEHRTRKSLLRCLNVQNRRVRFRDVGTSDIIPISPKESLGSTSGNANRTITPLQLSSAPEVWPCHVCTYLNAPSAMRCAACETLRSAEASNSHRSTPQQLTPKSTPKSTPRSTPKMAPQTPPPIADDADATAQEENTGVDREEEELEETKTATAATIQHDAVNLSETTRHNDDDLSLPASVTSQAVSPPVAVYADPTLLEDEPTPTANSTFHSDTPAPATPTTMDDEEALDVAEAKEPEALQKHNGWTVDTSPTHVLRNTPSPPAEEVHQRAFA